MRDPLNLFEVNPDVHVPAGIPLVAGLTGYSDPGSAVAEMTTHLRSNLERTTVATFDTDELFDYRARRHGATVSPAERVRTGLPVGTFCRGGAAPHRHIRCRLGDMAQCDTDARSAHSPDRGDGQWQPTRAHRGTVRVASDHAVAGQCAAPGGIPTARAGPSHRWFGAAGTALSVLYRISGCLGRRARCSHRCHWAHVPHRQLAGTGAHLPDPYRCADCRECGTCEARRESRTAVRLVHGGKHPAVCVCRRRW